MIKRKFWIWVGLIALVHIVLVFSFGVKKKGFHEDEYYTYWSVSSEGIGPSNLTWHSGYELQSRFFVKDGQQFSFDMVVENQAEDVHPPLYYLALHVLMSCFPNSFYKWFGILLNLLFSLVTYAGIVVLFLNMGEERRYGKGLALLAGFIYAAAPSTISAVMLTRMYAMSTMWTVLYAVLFVLLLKNIQCDKKKFAMLTVAGAILCYCALLTHYYALFVPFFLTLAYCLYVLVQRKEMGRMLIYGASMLVAIGLGMCTYPAAFSHIFSGYRGTDAISGLLKDTLFGRAEVFIRWLDSGIFAGWLLPCFYTFLAFVFIGILLIVCKWIKPRPKGYVYQMGSLIVACLCSFWLLTKVALLVGEDSSRYFFPVIAMFLPIMVYVIGAVAFAVKDALLENRLSERGKKHVTIVVAAAVFVVGVLPIIHMYYQGRVQFLYEKDAEKVAFSQEYSEYPLIMAYDTNTRYRSWYVDNQLWPFEKVLYVENEYLSQIDDPTICDAEKIVVYMDAPIEYLQAIIDKNPKLSTYHLVRHDAFFYVYLLE